MNSKAIRKQLLAAVAMVLVAAVALGSSTYAWFVNNTQVKAESTDFTASTAYTLMISAGKDATTANTRTSDTGWVTTHPMENNEIAFRPVSTIGSTSGTALSYVYDAAWATDATDSKHYANTFKDADGTEGQAALANANVGYLKETFQIKASQACDLYLDSDTVIKVVDKTNGTDGSGNVASVARVALTVTGTSGNKTFVYKLDGDTGAGTATTKLNTSINSSSNANGVQYAIKNDGTSAQITADNIGSDSKVKQLATATAAGNTALLSTLNSADKLYTFNAADEVCTVTVYVWMEGSDYDCNAAETTNFLGANEVLRANFSFAAAPKA